MATAHCRAAVCPVVEVAGPRMALASGMSTFRGAPIRVASLRAPVTRRVAVNAQAVAQAVKPTSPARKGDAISSEAAKELYRDMVLGREFEEMCAQMYYRGKMFGFVHLYSGQEAVSTGKPPPSKFLGRFSLLAF
jgi:pyruvate dehydrogenase E1 component alpha subunit